jgi:hypothetical protein
MPTALQTDRMILIAYAVSHTLMRRSLVGALATDRVIPERPA